jgi:hypothetical protein
MIFSMELELKTVWKAFLKLASFFYNNSNIY